MQTIIEQVLAEEEKARQRLDGARQKTSSLRKNADEEAETLLAQARIQASTLVKERMEKARLEARDSLNRAVAEEERKNSSLLESARGKIPDLAADVAAMILKSGIRED